MKYINRLIGAWIVLTILIFGTAHAQVYPYFPPPGMTYGPTTGLELGTPTGGLKGAGTLNAAGLYINGTAVGTSSAVGANPSATLGLSVINGSATTFLRSDGSPALSQAIAPVWTGTHMFNGGIINSVATGGINLGQSGGEPVFRLVDTTGATNTKAWQISTGASGATLSFQVVSDDWSTTFKNYFTVTRSGTTLSNLSYGNATDNNTYSFLGTGTATFNGAIKSTFGSGAALVVSTPAATTANIFQTTQSGQTSWEMFNTASTNNLSVWNSVNGTTLTFGNDTGITTNGQTDEGAGTFNAAGLYAAGSLVPSIASSPTLTGTWTFSPGTGNGIIVNESGSTSYAIKVNGSATAGTSKGVWIAAGTNASDNALQITSQSGTSYLNVVGDGGTVVGSATGGDQGLGTLNAAGLYVNGVAVATGAGSGANPTSLVSTSVINGTATTFMRSDAAPAINQSISPIMTGSWVFNPSSSSATPVTIDAPATSGYPLKIVNNSTNYSQSISFTNGTSTAGFGFNAGTASPFNISSNGGVQFLNTGTTTSVTIEGVNSAPAATISGESGTSGVSQGLLLTGGSTSADYALLIDNYQQSVQYAKLFGDGGMTFGPSGTADEGAGTVNASSGIYIGAHQLLKIASGLIGGTASCSVTGSLPSGAIASCVRNSAGNYTLTFGTGFFSTATNCTLTPTSASQPITLLVTNSATTAQFISETLAGTATDTPGISIMCTGL